MRAMAKSLFVKQKTATEMARALTAALGTTSDITPAQLQKAAEQTIMDLERERRERSQTEIPGAIVQGGDQGGTSPSTGRQTAQRPAVMGAFAGAGLVLLLLLLRDSAVFFFFPHTHSTPTTPPLLF